MMYLGNGQYQITNSQTGERKIVGGNELSNYGLQPNLLNGNPVNVVSAQGNQPTSLSETSDQSPSVKGFLNNVGSDIGANVQGILSLPGVLGNVLTGKIGLGDTLSAVGGGLVNEYKNLLTNPLGQAYNRPVSTVLDVLPFLQLGKAAFGGKAATTAGEVGNVAQTAEDVANAGKTTALSNILQKAPQATELTAPSQLSSDLLDYLKNFGKATPLPTATPNALPFEGAPITEATSQVAQGAEAATPGISKAIGNAGLIENPTKQLSTSANYFKAAFPLSEAQSTELRLPQMAETMTKYGVKSGFGYNKLINVSDAFTGPNGFYNAIVEDAASKIKGAIPIVDVSTNIDNALDKVTELLGDNKAIDQIRSKINSIVLKNPITGEEAYAAGQLPQISGDAAVQAYKDLDKMAAQFAGKSTLKAQEISNVYKSASQALKDSVAVQASKEGIMAEYGTQPYIDRISQIADKFGLNKQAILTDYINAVNSNNPQSFRSLQAPFVNLNKASIIAQNAPLSPGMKNAVRIGVGAAGFAGGGPVGAAAAELVGYPILETPAQVLANQLRPKITTGLASLSSNPTMNAILEKSGATAGAVGNVLKAGGGAAISALQNPVTYNLARQLATQQTQNLGNQNMGQTNQLNNILSAGNNEPQGVTGQQITPQMVQEAYLKLSPQMAARVANAYQAQFGGLSASSVLNRNTLLNQTAQLSDLIDKNASKLGQLNVKASNLGSILNVGDPQIQALQATLAGYNQRVASLIGGGASSKQLEQLLPNLGTDSVQRIKSKLSALQGIINSVVPFEQGATQ